MYNDKVMMHFKKPKNMGEIKNPDAKAQVGNPRCGDLLSVTMKIDKKTKIIKDIKFKTFGCVAAVACSSVTTELVKGKTIDEAKKLTKQDVVKEFGDLPAIKVHCSLLSTDAVKKAIQDYEKKEK